MRLKVLIIGAGALGKSLAALLADHAQVMVYERNPIARRALMKGSIILQEKGCRLNQKIDPIASLTDLKEKRVDILIFATKIKDLKEAVRQTAGIDPKTVFIPQNGLFDLLLIKRIFKKARISRGVTTMACQETGPCQATVHYRGEFYLGGDGAVMLAGFFRRAGFRARAYRDPSGPVWSKLIFSAVMNPLPVLSGKGYDVLKTDHYIWELVKKAIKEGRAVARSLGVKLSFDPLKLIHRVRQGDLAGISHRGTISQDIKAGRMTELYFITGALIRQARKSGVKVPALETIMLKAQLAGA